MLEGTVRVLMDLSNQGCVPFHRRQYAELEFESLASLYPACAMATVYSEVLVAVLQGCRIDTLMLLVLVQ